MKAQLLFATAITLLTTSSFALTHPTRAIHPTNQVFTPVQQKAIEQIVHSYLVKHPEILVEATQALQSQQATEQESQSLKAISAHKQALFNDPNTPTAGNPNGSVYVVEFFDYQCGHCRSMSAILKKVMASNKNVKFFFKELPIFGDASQYAAEVALAANKQGQYLALHNALFSLQDALSKDKVNQLAQSMGLNVAALTTELKNPNYSAQIRANFALAQKLGIMGTPAFVISNKAQTRFQFIPGAVNQQDLEAAITAVQK